MMQIDRFSQSQARMSRTRAARYLSSTALVTLVALGAVSAQMGAVSAQDWTGAVNSDYGTAGNWDTGVVPGDGNANNARIGAVVNDVADVAPGDAFTPGSLAAEANATVNIDGSLTTTTDISDAATVNVDANGADDGAGNDQLVGNVTVRQDGTLQVNANGTVVGDVTAGGTTATVGIANGGTVTGNVAMNIGDLTVDGAIGGNLTTTGGPGSNTVTVGGTVAGATSLTGAIDATVSGALNNGLTVGRNSDVTIAAGGSVTGATTVDGSDLTVAAGGTLNSGLTLNGSQSEGDVNAAGTINGVTTINGGTFNATGATLDDLTINAGTLDVDTGNLTVGGTFTNNGQVRVSDGRSIAFGTMTNTGSVTLLNGTPGNIDATLAGSVAGGGGTIDMQNGAANDSFTITGGLSGTNILALDVDLTTTNAGFADTLSVNGTVDGALGIDINAITNGGVFTLQQTPITLVDGGALGGALAPMRFGDLTPGTTGIINYSLIQDPATSDIQLQSQVNPAIGGVAAAFSSVQNVVGTVVNRPSGAYVSGIAFDAPDNCSTGVWGRVLGGQVDADSTTRNVTPGLSAPGTVDSRGSLKYGGIQGGADFGCFEAFEGGWDISGGLLLGASSGDFTERAAGLITAGDFDQYFIGGYVAAARGNWSGEMQVRYNSTDFTFDNPALDVRDADASVDSYAISGSVTYRQELQPGLALLPTAGFSVTDSDSTSLAFTSALGNRSGTLTVDDHTSVTSFFGATLSNTVVNEAAAQATNVFLTGTYYIDSSGSRKSTFTGVGGGSNILKTSETGDFGEISAGGSIVRLLGKGPGGARQVNYSVRVDARYGDDLDGVGVTGQVRYQF